MHCLVHILKVQMSVRRFVGMLLAASTMPKDDTHKLQQVHDAAGSAFFDRLLIPLKSQQVISDVFVFAMIDEQLVQVARKLCNFP